MNKIFKLVIILLFTLTAGTCNAANLHSKFDNISLTGYEMDIQESEIFERLALEEKSQEVTDAPVIESRVEQIEEKPKPVEIVDEVDSEYSIFNNVLDTNQEVDHPLKIEEESLFGKILKMEVTRTSVATYLLKEELTFKIDKGPVDKVWLFGAYQGNLNNNWQSSDHDTTYRWGFMDIGLFGHTRDPKTSFLLRTSVNPSSSVDFWNGFVTDAYIVNTRIPHHKIILGNSRNHVGYEGGAASYTLPFAARSQISRTFGNTRALGVRVVGEYSLVDYDLAFSSSSRYWRQFFPGAEFTGWLNLKPLGKTDGKYGKLIVGGGLNAGKNETSYTIGSAYIGYTYKKFMANFEYAIADGYNGAVQSTNKASGFYTTVGYRITPKIHFIARYDQFDPNRDIANNKREEVTAGINYFIKGQAIRLILNYVYCRNQNGPDSNRVILGTQFLL